MLANIYSALLILHICTGAASLFVFCIPLVARKGSPLHIRSGRWYANLMYTVAVSALVLALIVMIDPIGAKYSDRSFDQEEINRIVSSHRYFGLFLFAIGVLVLANVRHAILVLKAKRNHSLVKSKSHVSLNLALATMSVSLIVIGWVSSEILFFIFAGICGFVAFSNLRYCFKREISRTDPVVQHLQSMIAAGIGSFTAFAVFGGNQFFSSFLQGSWNIVPWVAPGVIGGIASIFMTRKYSGKRKKA